MIVPRTLEDSTLIGLTGDVMIGRLVEKTLSKVESSYIWGNMLPWLQATDFNLINFEAALTTHDQEVLKTFNFKAKPERVESLSLASIGAVNLANNHSLDYSEEGLLETLQALDQVKIRHVGAGKNLEEAKNPTFVNVQGIKIGIIGCTDNEPSWLADKNKPGTNFVEINDLGLAEVKAQILKLKGKVDFIILSFHWGPNMREHPPSHFQKFAHEVLDCGVDLFHGHSAHIFQGIEIYNKKMILYDTGDFIDDYKVDPFLRNDRSFFFIVEISKSGILGMRLIPTLIDNCQVNSSKGWEKEQTMNRMEKLSKDFGTRFIRTKEGLAIHQIS
jgi:poly-gamma-glutamate synthesis protein (capsule biosynthesis protein)